MSRRRAYPPRSAIKQQLYGRDELGPLLEHVGFEVEILDNYRSPAVHPDLPGWYVVEARKPA